ncbi:hypothetical protein SEA_CATERPILLAR_58 [Arthrobacter phage Caterpillar]|nr:hypothetical protein SEA_CATERPILLAR_58 [Arthrobacter phage Caterpillar]
MSETQNNDARYEENLAGLEEPDALEHYVRSGDYQAELDAAKEQQERNELAADDNGQAELEEAVRTLPQTEVIVPVIMPKGDQLAALGDAVFNPETNKMVVSFNTEAGREIAEFIGTGMLAAISFRGHMLKRD